MVRVLFFALLAGLVTPIWSVSTEPGSKPKAATSSQLSLLDALAYRSASGKADPAFDGRCRVTLEFPLSGRPRVTAPSSARNAGNDRGSAPGSWFMAQRAYPAGTVPEHGLADAMMQRRAIEMRFRSQTEPSGLDAANNWSSIGPSNINGPEGTASGRVTTIAVDSRNPETLYIGAAGGGVWRSVDGGGTWQPLGDNLLSLASGALALDERNGILYYGTGDYGAGTYGAGVLKSSDGGSTWANASGWDSERNKPQFGGGTIPRLLISPADPKTIYVARNSNNSGLYRSTNGGDNWTWLIDAPVSDLALEPGSPNRLWLAVGRITGDPYNAVYRSPDGGINWNRVSNLPIGNEVGRISLAIAPGNPGVIYVVLARSSDQQLHGLYRSTDGGFFWSRLPAPESLFDSGGRGHGYFDNFIAVDPRDHNTVYLGGVELWKSSDGGMSWHCLSLINGNRVIHEDQFAMAFKPGNPDTIYLGNDGGIYKSNDSGASWMSMNSGLPITQFNSIAVHPQNSLVVIGGTQDQGLVRFSGNSVWDQLFRGDAGVALYDATNPANIAATKQFTRIMRSGDAGGSFANIGGPIDAADRVDFYAPLAVTPDGSNLFFGTQRVWSSNTGGAGWTPISSDLTNGGVLSALAVSADGQHVYAGSSDGRVSISGFAGSWRTGTAVPNRWIKSIAPDPRDPSIAYLAVSGFGTGHVFRTLDGGFNWMDISGNLPDVPANSVAVDPRGPIYVATDIGVFRSEDGDVWTSFNAGLPNVFVTALALDPRSGTLTAATYGRGAYQISLKAPQSGPNILASGVVSAATLLPMIAPGAIATLYGSRLAPGQTAGQGSPLPTSLAGTSITVNGQPAPLIFVSPNQINFQVPFEATGTQAVVVVTTPEGRAAIPVQLLPTAPGLFAGTVTHASTGAPVDANNPAVPGETLVLFATGLGVTSPAAVSGLPAPSNAPAVTANVSASFGGLAAPVPFAGLAPGFVGLFQVNVQVPDGASGTMLLTIFAGGRASNAVTIVVRQ